ncbi:hypothetical protein IVB45_02245 [Bradyrhizobium sp. 4]|uniref:hypothetical protein n=1 Tax=Bradyrhizobium sp. 4 TaxID=2782678 RepID=UPI001FFEBDA5|nr:hypothetical protein [Bradyrhizobium sp. 4]UPJ35855.1 hypothetical protein IVB45_02245 [Bradyrhizobium sp. 4]
MSQDEEAYKAVLAKAGVDLPELKDTPKEEPEAPEAEEPKDEPEEPKEPLKEEPKEQRKRSIYDVYKEEKSERKTAEARAEQAEKERDEAKRLLEEAVAAKGTDDEKETAKDAVEYAKKVGADPDLVKRIIEDARKGFEQKPDESLQKDIAEFKAWKTTNAKSIEQSMFNDEFEKSVPSLKKLFPTVNDEELKTIKAELDTLSHTKEWHDKSLAYVAFEHQDKLSALVSPKKRGMESKGRKEVEQPDFEFNPEADYSKMTMAERKEWEKTYKELTKKSEGLMTNAQGKKILI